MSKHNRVWHIPASSWTLQKNQASYMSICINAICCGLYWVPKAKAKHRLEVGLELEVGRVN